MYGGSMFMRRQINLFALFLCIGMIVETAQGDPTSSPMIVFTKNTDQKPYYSVWNGTAWSPSSGTAMPSIGSCT